ncbi:MMB_0454 family protein [Mycoplasma putrefaciens]|uniref:Uncharacterized protein n=2 Tax=Mycoplasma putrefaciens TaxID=2123 RepID=M9WHI4_9MOLU|nr:hypothetical protein [Mycoplasma putrefaciens]AEM68693.1 uncharacterized protein MPUT_0315 [Mycoplasma putrefaciens KS1]AGJ90844.1 Hypothetical protein MPUT9231_4340 [Mycoplasma putrefaciens Mput9231]SYV95860.1 Uncharacterised protein [Mycoplasma putrefaciens]
MYISIDKNRRGNLEIEQRVINKIVKNTVLLNSAIDNLSDINVSTSVFQEDQLYILITVKVRNKIEDLKINKDKLLKSIDKNLSQTISIKPKNINISYIK